MALVDLLLAVAGVGSSRCASISNDLPWPLPLPWAACILAVQASQSSGVFPRPMSLTAGVGRSVGKSRNIGPPAPRRFRCAWSSAPVVSLALGVGNDEKSGPLVRRSGVGCSHNSPSASPPHAGKVSEDRVKAQREVASDVFQDCESRSHFANGAEDMRPEVSVIVGAFPQASMAKWLAGVAAREYVDGLHAAEVQLGYVAVVGDAGEVVVKDA